MILNVVMSNIVIITLACGIVLLLTLALASLMPSKKKKHDPLRNVLTAPKKKTGKTLPPRWTYVGAISDKAKWSTTLFFHDSANDDDTEVKIGGYSARSYSDEGNRIAAQMNAEALYSYGRKNK